MADAVPVRTPPVQRKGAAQGAAVGCAIKSVEYKTGGTAVVQGFQVGVCHGIGQAADAAHHVVGLGICHCPEGRRLFPELTVLKNLILGAYLRDDADAVAKDLERVYALFPILRDRTGQMVSTLSGGQQQMVAIGRALMGAPKLLLLDEPSVGIAHRLKHEIFDAIRQIRDGGVAILMAEQDALSALRIADRAYVLEHGHVARHGPVADLSKDDHIRQIYLGVA